MINIYLYLLKSTLCFVLFYGFYLLFLHRETFFHLNRFYLLGTFLFSVFVPFLNINFLPENSIIVSEFFSVNKLVTSSLPSMNSTQGTFSFNQVLVIVYISGALFFLIRFLSKLFHLIFLIKRFGINKQSKFKIVHVDEDYSPFTFFNYFFLPAKTGNEQLGEEIIEHEKIHLVQKHSVDIMLMELIGILYWFNPFLWLFKASIKSTHEYLADDGVILKGFDKVFYQEQLMTQSIGKPIFDISNYFNYSLLKNRLKMMTKEKSRNLIKIRYLGVIPLLFVTLMLLSTDLESTSNVQGNDGVSIKDLDNADAFKEATDEARQFIAKTIRYPVAEVELNSQGRIFVICIIDKSGKVTEVGIRNKRMKGEWNGLDEVVVIAQSKGKNQIKESDSNVALEKEAIRVVSLIPDFPPALYKKKKVECNLIFLVNFVLQKSVD